MTEEERVRQWRASLAEELDSDDDEFGCLGPKPGMRSAGLEDDLGLDLPAPPRLHLQMPRDPTCSTPPPRSGDGQALEQKVRVLETKLAEKEIELDQLHMASPVQATGEAQDQPREAKLREIVRRSKAAMVALNKERAKNLQLTEELAAARRSQSSSPPATAGSAAVAAGSGAAAARLESANLQVREGRDGAAPHERECKALKAQAQALSAKLLEQKASAHALKAELKNYARALAREVGEEVPPARVRELLDEASGAKGRSQQITLLREQNRELKLRLASGGALADAPAAAPTDGRPRAALDKVDGERRREMERLLLREEQLTAEVAEGRKKADAQAARLRTLEQEGRARRERFKTLLEKSDADDKLVGALRAELEKAKGAQPSREKELASRAAAQQAQITRQESIIVALRDQLERTNETVQQMEAARRDEEGATMCAARPVSAPRALPQDLIVARAENDKLRELVTLLHEKLAQAGRPSGT